jgi:quercetin 2,3-dioxygenase
MYRVCAAEPGLRPYTEVRRAEDRFVTTAGWLESRHSFSFGHHYDPANTHFGLLVASNDDVVLPGTGFDSHPHRDMEIVTWVLQGSLVHRDSAGHTGLIGPGLAQRMSAGSGIVHSERNDSWRLTGDAVHDEPVRFVQMWVVPDEEGIEPGYEQRDIADALRSGGLVTIASGMPEHRDATVVRIHQRDAALHVARLRPRGTVALPPAAYAHVYVARGEVALEGAGPLRTGDAARVTVSEGQRVTATTEAEVLVWQMRSRVAA